MVVITGYYANLTETMAKGTKVLFVATSDHFPSHPTTKDGRATDSCFTLIWGSCATLMSSNQGETAVCNSSILCWVTGEAIRSSVPHTRVYSLELLITTRHKEQTAVGKFPTRMKATVTMCMYILCLYISEVTASNPHLPWLLSKIRALPLETMT